MKSKIAPTERFSGLADLYSQYRPSYPDSAIQFIIEHCGLNNDSTLVDVGSGTGISSRLFAARCINVIGVEPNADMRNQAVLDSMGFSDNLQYVEGTAEATGLPDGIAKVVLCAQAFHWFDPCCALSEFYRILESSGWTCLIWNERDESDSFTKEYGDLLRKQPETRAVEVQRGKAGEVIFQKTALYENQELTMFSNKQILDLDGLLGRAFSASYAPKEPDAVKAFSDKLRVLFAKFQEEGRIGLCCKVSVYLGRKK